MSCYDCPSPLEGNEHADYTVSYRIITPDWSIQEYENVDSLEEAYRTIEEDFLFSTNPEDNEDLRIEKVVVAEAWRYSAYSIDGQEMAKGGADMNDILSW